MLQTQNSYSESFTLQTSSVFTEQFQADSQSKRDWAHLGEVRHMSRIRQYGNAEECEFTGNSSLVDSGRSRHVPGNRARDDLLDIMFFFTRTLLDCEDLWSGTIVELVENVRYYKTHPDMDDGFGGFTPSCREYSRPRQDAVLTVLGAIPARTVIGPVLQFAVVKFMGTYGIWNWDAFTQ